MGSSEQGLADFSRFKIWKIGLSLVLALHLLAVVAEPLQFFSRSPRGTSPVTDPIRSTLGPYVEFAYLNHGYFFFAPDPGPSHLLACDLEFESGEKAKLTFPDLETQWPRLLYHRHFMLAEFLNQLHVPPVPTSEFNMNPRVELDWRRSRLRYEMILGSMEDHLRTRYQASSVEIRRLEHLLPSSDQVLIEKIPLQDPRFYIVLPDDPSDPQAGQFDAGLFEAEQPTAPPMMAPLMLSPSGTIGNAEEIVP